MLSETTDVVGVVSAVPRGILDEATFEVEKASLVNSRLSTKLMHGPVHL